MRLNTIQKKKAREEFEQALKTCSEKWGAGSTHKMLESQKVRSRRFRIERGKPNVETKRRPNRPFRYKVEPLVT